MNLSERDKKLLIVLLIAMALGALYYFVYGPLLQKISSTEQEVNNLDRQYIELKTKMDNKSKYDKDLKVAAAELQRLDLQLPSDLRQENIILILKKAQQETGISFSNLTFKEVSSVTATAVGTSKAGSTTSNTNNNTNTNNTNTTSNTNNTNTKAPTATTNSNPAQNKANGQSRKDMTGKYLPNKTGIKMEITTTYIGRYDQVKAMMNWLYEYDNRIAIDSINFESSKTTLVTVKGNDQSEEPVDGDKVTGGIVLSFYGFKDDTKPIPPWELQLEHGKNDLFEYFDEYVETASNAPADQLALRSNLEGEGEIAITLPPKRDDFILTIKPVSSDLPVLMIGKSGDREGKSYLFEDNPKLENVEIEIINEDNKYYYKYKTQASSYPKNYMKDKVEFLPIDSALAMNILSCPRRGSDDLSGINLTVINRTGLIFNLNVKDEDPEKPRVNLVNSEGQVSLNK